MQQLKQNRWEAVELLASVSSSQQMKLVDFGVLSPVGSTFPEVWGQAECSRGSPQVLVDLSDVGPKSSRTVQEQEKICQRIAATVSPGQGNRQK